MIDELSLVYESFKIYLKILILKFESKVKEQA
jgi:hypothetical protein